MDGVGPRPLGEVLLGGGRAAVAWRVLVSAELDYLVDVVEHVLRVAQARPAAGVPLVIESTTVPGRSVAVVVTLRAPRPVAGRPPALLVALEAVASARTLVSVVCAPGPLVSLAQALRQEVARRYPEAAGGGAGGRLAQQAGDAWQWVSPGPAEAEAAERVTQGQGQGQGVTLKDLQEAYVRLARTYAEADDIVFGAGRPDRRRRRPALADLAEHLGYAPRTFKRLLRRLGGDWRRDFTELPVPAPSADEDQNAPLDDDAVG
jgi:hypothetical protein